MSLKDSPVARALTKISGVNASLRYSVLLFVVFVGASLLKWWGGLGDDLASGYVASRLIGNTGAEVVYAHDPVHFEKIDNTAWDAVHREAGFRGTSLHPYVQIPLWALLLKPLAMTLSFPTFNNLFLIINTLSIVGMAYCASSRFGSIKTNPVLIFLLLMWLWCSHPFHYAMQLNQTHPLLMGMVLLALVLAEKNRATSAGMLLAFAAVVKVTPGLLVLYWAMGGKWKAVVWFSVGAVLFVLSSFLLGGMEINLEYFRVLQRISNVLLVTWNNESLASTIMGFSYSEEMQRWRILPLPGWLKLTGVFLSVVSVSLAGFFRNRGLKEGMAVSIALIGITIFAPIAWTHYYFVLLVPMAIILGEVPERSECWIAVLLLACLTLYPPSGLFRPFFFSGLVILIYFSTIGWAKVKKSFPD